MGYDVIVVGGGIGGLGCAALLAKEGMKVLVLERSSFWEGEQLPSSITVIFLM